MLSAIILLAPLALAVEIEAPKTVRVGEAFHVVARLVNRSARPVSVVRPEPPTAPLGMRCGGGLFRAENPVATEIGGMRVGQYMVAWEFGPWAFLTLKPGESMQIEDVTYQKVYPSGRTPSLISELNTAPRIDLPQGEYILRFAYAFRPELDKIPSTKRRSRNTFTLTSEGRKLYESAWKGKVEAAVSVTVGDA